MSIENENQPINTTTNELPIKKEPEINKEPTTRQSIWELVRFAFIAIIIVIPIRMFVAQPFIVSGSSMVPTFQNDQYLIVDELTYHFKSPQRGDVIVFHYPNDPSKFFIKRIIGLPNETIDVKTGEVSITNKEHPDGFKVDQPYVTNHSADSEHYELKDGEYYVMGDNRPASYDSRGWGPVKSNLIVGRVFLRLLPFNKISTFPGDYKQLN